MDYKSINNNYDNNDYDNNDDYDNNEYDEFNNFITELRKIRDIKLLDNKYYLTLFDKEIIHFTCNDNEHNDDNDDNGHNDHNNDNIILFQISYKGKNYTKTLEELIIFIYKELLYSLCNIKYIPMNILNNNNKTTNKKDLLYNNTSLFLNEILSKKKVMSIMICDGLTYGINGGLILRSGSTFGFDNIFFCPPNKDEYNEKLYTEITFKDSKSRLHVSNNKLLYNNLFMKDVDRYSMISDNSINCKVHYNYDLELLIEVLKSLDYVIYVVENDSSDLFLHETKLNNDKIAFIVGNEKMGVSKYIRNKILIDNIDNTDNSIKILTIQTSKNNTSSSLNVAQASLLIQSKRSENINFI